MAKRSQPSQAGRSSSGTRRSRARPALSRDERPFDAPIPKTQTMLARNGDPLVTVDGEVVHANGHRSTIDVEAKKHQVKPSKFRPQHKRSMKELPAPVHILKGIACVFIFTMFGLSDREIAEALNITSDDVKKVRNHAAYSDVFEAVQGEFINANSDLITSRLAAYSHDALSSLANVAFNGKKENNVLRASESLLDRAGHTPKLQEHRGMGMRGGLTIVVVDGQQTVDVSVDQKEW